MKKIKFGSNSLWLWGMVVFLILEIFNYSVLSIFIPLKMCSLISVVMLTILLAYIYLSVVSLYNSTKKDVLLDVEQKNVCVLQKINDIYSSLNNIEKEVKELSYKTKKCETKNIKIADELKNIRRAVEQISNKIMLPIGQCSISGNKDIFEICIVTDGKQYKFNAEKDQITSYVKNGQLERYECK